MAVSHPPCQLAVKRVYEVIMDNVISGVRDNFRDEGVDEQVLEELRALWHSKMMNTGVVVDVDSGAENGSGHYKAIEQAETAPQMAWSSGALFTAAVVRSDPRTIVPVQISMPHLPGEDRDVVKKIEIKVRGALVQSDLLQVILSKPEVKAILQLPLDKAQEALQKLLDLTPMDVSPRTNLIGNNIAGFSGQVSPAVKRLNAILQSDGNSYDSDNSSIAEDENASDDWDVGLLGPKDLGIIKDSPDEYPDGLMVSEEDDQELEDLNETNEVLENVKDVVVCCADKIFRRRDKFTFHLRDGIMSLNGKEYVFQKANGDADW